MVRVRRPTSKISPPGWWCMVTVAASQVGRRAVSAETWMPPASSSTVWRQGAAAGRVPGHTPDVHRRRTRPARFDTSAGIGDSPPDPHAAARPVAGVPAETRSPRVRGLPPPTRLEEVVKQQLQGGTGKRPWP